MNIQPRNNEEVIPCKNTPHFHIILNNNEEKLNLIIHNLGLETSLYSADKKETKVSQAMPPSKSTQKTQKVFDSNSKPLEKKQEVFLSIFTHEIHAALQYKEFDRLLQLISLIPEVDKQLQWVHSLYLEITSSLSIEDHFDLLRALVMNSLYRCSYNSDFTINLIKKVLQQLLREKAEKFDEFTINFIKEALQKAPNEEEKLEEINEFGRLEFIINLAQNIGVEEERVFALFKDWLVSNQDEYRRIITEGTFIRTSIFKNLLETTHSSLTYTNKIALGLEQSEEMISSLFKSFREELDFYMNVESGRYFLAMRAAQRIRPNKEKKFESFLERIMEAASERGYYFEAGLAVEKMRSPEVREDKFETLILTALKQGNYFEASQIAPKMRPGPKRESCLEKIVMEAAKQQKYFTAMDIALEIESLETRKTCLQTIQLEAQEHKNEFAKEMVSNEICYGV